MRKVVEKFKRDVGVSRLTAPDELQVNTGAQVSPTLS